MYAGLSQFESDNPEECLNFALVSGYPCVKRNADVVIRKLEKLVPLARGYSKHTLISKFTGFHTTFSYPITQGRRNITVLELFYSSHSEYSEIS
jgi:hypothetical protein